MLSDTALSGGLKMSKQHQSLQTSPRGVLAAASATLLGVGDLAEWHGNVSNPDWKPAPTPGVEGVEAASYAGLPAGNMYQVRLSFADEFGDRVDGFHVSDRATGYAVAYSGQDRLAFASTYPEFSITAYDNGNVLWTVEPAFTLSDRGQFALPGASGGTVESFSWGDDAE